MADFNEFWEKQNRNECPRLNPNNILFRYKNEVWHRQMWQTPAYKVKRKTKRKK